MNYYGKAEETVNRIVDAFKSGNVPEPLAQVFIKKDGIPMSGWSWLNRFSCALAGCVDARGYKQWQAVGRTVKKGERSPARILIPLKDEDEMRLYGFKAQAVFDVTQTEGEPLPDSEEVTANLPLLEVARHFELDVHTYDGRQAGALGFYSARQQLIALGVENVATWLHELMHAADAKLGNLKERGQHWRSETVAELGGATLATLLGLGVEADTGGAYRYVKRYAEEANITVETACLRALDRICQAIDLIMTTAEQLEPA